MKSLLCSLALGGTLWAQQPLPPVEPLPPFEPLPPVEALLAVEAQIAWAQKATAQAAAQAAHAEAQAHAQAESVREAARTRERALRDLRERSSDDRDYRNGQSHLEDREWEDAAKAFQRVIDRKSSRADGAMYWKGYALFKLGRRDEALQTLSELPKAYPNSRWLIDARLLEAEVKQASGQPLSPEAQTDEDLKLYAINSLINTEPERAVPLLDRILQSSSSPQLRQRALFVLAQSKSPQARELVTKYAKGAGNPDLQAKAVEYFAALDPKESGPTLSEIYAATNDIGVKRAVMRGMVAAQDKDRLVAIAKAETTPELRRTAISYLGALNAQAELSQMYGSESDQKNKAQIIGALGQNRANATRLIEIARGEKDPQLKKLAVECLSRMKSKEATDFMVELLNK